MQQVTVIAKSAFFALALTFILAETASAQAIIRAVYTLSVTDPDSGNVMMVERPSVRSWASTEACEREKDSFKSRHQESVEGVGLMSQSGKPAAVKIESTECYTVRAE